MNNSTCPMKFSVTFPLVCAAMLATAIPPARATVVYDSGGFESPRFSSGVDLGGQDPVVPPVGYGPWHKDTGAGTATVQTDLPGGGLQSVKVTRTANASGDTRWGINVPITPTVASNVVSIDFDLYVTINPGTNWGGSELGPLFGIECYDNSGLSPKLIGSVFLDAYAGDVLYQQAGSGNLQTSGTFMGRDEYHHYTLAANFRNKTYSIYVDGGLVHTEGFVDATATSFTDAPITALAATPGSSSTASGTAYIDNYTVSLDTSRLNYLVWRGDGTNNLWNTTTASNWFNGDYLDRFSNNVPVLFGDTGSNTPSVSVQGSVQPAAITVSADQSYTITGPGSIGGSGILFKRGNGTLTLTGNNSYSGGTSVSNGTLLVNNTVGSGTGAGLVYIASGATLGGNGTIGGPVTVANGGIVAPSGNLTISNDLTLVGNAVLDFTAGTTGTRLAVSSNLNLSGVMNITDGAGFGIGTYTLINYGGTLSGSTPWIASKPSGYDCTLDTNTPGQINLIVSVPPSPPLAPSGLNATAVSDSQVNLAWTDNSTNETAFFIERSINNSVFSQIGSVGVNVTSFSDTGLSSSTAYYYRIRASNSGGNSPYSGSVGVTTLLSTNPPVSWYKFELNTLDSSGSGNDGVPVGGLLYGSGKVGTYSAQFDGTSSFIEIQPVARTNFTIAMWVQTTNSISGGAWYSGAGLLDGEVFGSAADWGSSILNSKFAVGIGNPDTTISSSVSVTDGAWHHLAATRDSATGLVKLYVDGKLNTLGLAPTGPRSAPNDLRIGATHANVPGRFAGNMDDLRIYDHVLADAEVAVLAGRAARIASIKADGSNVVVSGRNGSPGGTYYVLSSTNITLPLAQWTREATNQFDDAGSCTYTNAMNPDQASKFFLLQLP